MRTSIIERRDHPLSSELVSSLWPMRGSTGFDEAKAMGHCIAASIDLSEPCHKSHGDAFYSGEKLFEVGARTKCAIW